MKIKKLNKTDLNRKVLGIILVTEQYLFSLTPSVHKEKFFISKPVVSGRPIAPRAYTKRRKK